MKRGLSFPYSFNALDKGSGILEMLMCVPLALLFLFVAIDVGLSFLDRAMITDTVRETVHEYAPSHYHETSAPMFRVEAGGISYGEESISSYTKRIAERLRAVVSERRSRLGSSSSLDDVKIMIMPLKITIDTSSGLVTGYQQLHQLSSSAGNQGLVLGPKVNVISENTFLDNLFSSAIRGSYAIPAIINSNSTERYLPESLGILVSVEAISPSVNPALVELVLGSNLGIQMHEFQLVRN